MENKQKAKPEIILLMDSATGVGVDGDDPIPKTSKTHLSRGGLNLSKPRARFAETPPPPKTNIVSDDDLHHLDTDHHNKEFAANSSSSSSDEDDDEMDDDSLWSNDVEEDDGANDNSKKKKKKNYKSIFITTSRKNIRKMKKRALVEFLLFLVIMTCLVCSLTLASLKHELVWGLEIWKWCLMIMVIFCGRLVSAWVVGFMVFLIERNFMLREKVLYFVFGLRKSFQNCIWLALVLLCWIIMFPEDIRKQNQNAVMKKMFRGLVAVLIGATIWLLKIVLVKVSASSFHVATFFDRMKESVFHHYILDALSGPPLELEDQTEEEHQTHLRNRLRCTKSLPPRFGNQRLTTSTSISRKIDMEKLRKLSMSRRASAWSIKKLVNYVRSYGLSTISRTVDDFAESEINSEWGARNCAQTIFKNVAKPGAKYIQEEDLLRFLKSEEVHTIFPLFEGALETGKITKSSLRNWVVHAYIERKALAHSLNDTKTAVQQLHRLASAIVVVIIIVVSLLVMGLATIKVIFVVTSQLLLVGFVFQNTCKTIFESIIFVFVMHPFDVGDRCVVDGVQMVVEEMNILTTVFLRYDMEKIYYPNSALLTKPISNFRRSPDMGDGVEFTIDASTPIDHINALKKAIQAYIESKPKHWSPKHSLIFKDIEDINKLKMGLYVQHTINHQNYGEKSIRRSELVFELKKVFENIGIKYNLLPQEVHLTQMVNNNAPNASRHF